MKLGKGIVNHTIIVCVAKSDKRQGLVNLLKSKGHIATGAANLYEGLKLISQEMPHLVISDALFSDGTAGTLFDRLAAHGILKRTPILVLVAAKTKELLAPLKGRKFAGFLLGKLEQDTFLQKVRDILANNVGVSPYFLSLQNHSIEKSFVAGIPACILGRDDGNLVCHSESEIHPQASLVCVAQEKTKAPALLKMAANSMVGEKIHVYFPMTRIRGKGRAWLEGLPDLGQGETSQEARKVIFFDPNKERFEQFKSILAGYGIELVHAPSLQMTAPLIVRYAGELGAIYLNELTSDAAALPIKQALTKLPTGQRVPLVVGTSSLNSRSTSEICYIKKPFGLGTLVETFQSIFASSQISETDSKKTAGVDVIFQMPAELIGLDEIGGIIQLKFPLAPGSVLFLDHDELKNLWGDSGKVRVESAVSMDEQSTRWHLRFSLLSIGSKTKYWEKLTNFLPSSILEKIG